MSYVIKDMPGQAEPGLLEKCGKAETATIGHRRHTGFMDRGIQSILNDRRTVAGTAVTLAIPGQDSTLLHHVVQFLRPGDILCIDRLGDHKHACLGGGGAAAIKYTGCAAVVIDGPCTDVPEIEHYGLPVWCRGTAPITTRLYDIGGSFNIPVAMGGAVVNPGDVVIADFSGVLVLPPDEAEADVDWALEKQAGEPEGHKKILAGKIWGTRPAPRQKCGRNSAAEHRNVNTVRHAKGSRREIPALPQSRGRFLFGLYRCGARLDAIMR